MLFQIRVAAVVRSLNFLTGVTPGRLFQMATQPLRRPTGGQVCQFLLAGEDIKRGRAGGGRLFRGAMRRDVVVSFYGESRHNRFLGAALNAVMTMDHSVRPRRQVICSVI